MPKGKATGQTRFPYTRPGDVRHRKPSAAPWHRRTNARFRGASGVFLQEQKRFFQVISLRSYRSTVPSSLCPSLLFATQQLRAVLPLGGNGLAPTGRARCLGYVHRESTFVTPPYTRMPGFTLSECSFTMVNVTESLRKFRSHVTVFAVQPLPIYRPPSHAM